MAEITPAAWAVLRAAHTLESVGAGSKVDTKAVRATTLEIDPAVAQELQSPAGNYAGVAEQLWELQDAGYVAVLPGMAQPVRPGAAAHAVVEPYGVGVTPEGREALDKHLCIQPAKAIPSG